MKKYKRIVDNKMKGYGDIDTKKKVIRVNKKLNAKIGKGELLDTIVHEDLHRKHPKQSEKKIEKLTSKKTKHMSKITRSKMYGSFAK